MKNLTIIKSQEYHANQPSVFAKIDNRYVGCLIYPHSRNYPSINYWTNSTSSDIDRGFEVIEKQFTEEEITNIITLQNAIDSLTALIPNQPQFEYINCEYKVKRGKAYEDYKTKYDARNLEIKKYFDSIAIFDRALTKAKNDLRKILNK